MGVTGCARLCPDQASLGQKRQHPCQAVPAYTRTRPLPARNGIIHAWPCQTVTKCLRSPFALITTIIHACIHSSQARTAPTRRVSESFAACHAVPCPLPRQCRGHGARRRLPRAIFAPPSPSPLDGGRL